MSRYPSLPAALLGAAGLVVLAATLSAAPKTFPAGPRTVPAGPSAALAQAPSAEGEAPILIRAERIVVRPGEVLEGGVVLVRDGRIAAVGKPEEVVVPE